MTFIIYLILTFVWLCVLHMFYTSPSNTIVLTPLYIVFSANPRIAPNGSLFLWLWLCEKSLHPP